MGKFEIRILKNFIEFYSNHLSISIKKPNDTNAHPNEVST